MRFAIERRVVKRNAWNAYRWLLDLLLPPCCVKCQRVGAWLCETCVETLTPPRQPFCPRCGRPQERWDLCAVCRTAPLRVNPIRSVFFFEGHVRDAIHALKYRGGSDIAEQLGDLMVTSWRTHDLQSDLLVPVPLFFEREARRGYNQAALLAAALGARLSLPVRLALMRTRNTQSQTQLSREERRRNVEAAFAVDPAVDLAGKRVTLIDDVATTGATLDACAVALLGSGAQTVNAFTLARAP